MVDQKFPMVDHNFPWGHPVLRAMPMRRWLLFVALFWILKGGPLVLYLAGGCFLIGFLTESSGVLLSAKLLTAGFLWTMLSAFWLDIGSAAAIALYKRQHESKFRELSHKVILIGIGFAHSYFFLMFWPALCAYIAFPYAFSAEDGPWTPWIISFVVCLYVYYNRAVRKYMYSESEEEKKNIKKDLARDVFVGGIGIFWCCTLFPKWLFFIYGWMLPALGSI